jgi:hypothetical protein
VLKTKCEVSEKYFPNTHRHAIRKEDWIIIRNYRHMYNLHLLSVQTHHHVLQLSHWKQDPYVCTTLKRTLLWAPVIMEIVM